MRFAIVDLGSNTIRLSVYNTLPEGGFDLLFSEKEMAGLVSYVHGGVLSPEGIQRACGAIRDFQALLRGSIVPTHYFVYLRERPAAEHPGLMTLPAGNWLCMQSRILAEPFPGPELKRYFRDQETPRLVVANEYEDNFRSFRNCIYEVQIFQHS